MKTETLLTQRRSRVLTPSSLWCISRQPTINITRGCLHRCAYCYARGYRTYPGDGRVVVYINTAAQLRAELDRRRSRPPRVYFSPSSDPFQDLPEVLEETFHAMRTLLRRGIPISFLTKGAIPQRFLDLFSCHPTLVHGQVSITTLDEGLQRLVEPMAAPPWRRLLDLRRLARIGVRAEARLDPLIPTLTDSPVQVRRLLAALAAMGITSAAVNYLILRPTIRLNLYRDLRGRVDLRRVFHAYREGVRLKMRGSGAPVLALPAWYRRSAYRFITRTAAEFGIAVRVCGCKNPDITPQRCNIAGWTTRSTPEPTLFAL